MIHVVGNAAIDTVIRVDHLPQRGETIVALGAADDLGGKGANQAIVIARCECDVRLVASVGDDLAGERIRRNLAAEGVRIDGLRIWTGRTDRCVICVDRDGENTIVSVVDAASSFDPIGADCIGRRVAPGDWMILQGNLRASVTRACLALAKEKGALTALNPSPVYLAAEYDWSLVDLVVLNSGEAVALGGCPDPIEAARALLAAGAESVVVTLGAEGAMLLSGRDTMRVRAAVTAAVDTTGAGDVFCGALIASRAAGRRWREALIVAAEAAAICVARAGVLASFPTREELAAVFRRPIPEPA
ncbi:MAG TPA: PfkB family carbohydrate kinase [Roseiarcus sp.]|jgi:ribokinase|nr:PfkB family carbohydrate kinase [Roseiarcus sp.]